MKKISTLTIIAFCILLQAQAQSKQTTITSEQLSKTIAQSNAAMAETKRKMDSTLNEKNRVMDSLNNASNLRNLDRLTQEIKQREAGKKKKAYLFIFMGIGFLAILVIGLLRKTKK
jgi:hypothetical protein